MKLIKREKTPVDAKIVGDTMALEARDLRKTTDQRIEAEATKDVVNEEIGKLIDAAREDPTMVIDEEDTSVQKLKASTGRSGAHAAVRDPIDPEAPR